MKPRAPQHETTSASGSLRPLLLYDGHCPLCNGTVRLLLRADRRGRLLYSPLAGETASAIKTRRPEIRQVDSVALVTRAGDGTERVALRSTAVLDALRALGGGWRLAARLFSVVPRWLRDRVYDFVAVRRQCWFGALESCPLPPAEVRSRFLP